MDAIVAEEVIRVAVETNADALVISPRHRALVDRLITGSGAHQILFDAPCWATSVKQQSVCG